MVLGVPQPRRARGDCVEAFRVAGRPKEQAINRQQEASAHRSRIPANVGKYKFRAADYLTKSADSAAFRRFKPHRLRQTIFGAKRTFRLIAPIGWRARQLAQTVAHEFGGCFTVRSSILTRRRLRGPAAHSPQTGGWRKAG